METVELRVTSVYQYSRKRVCFSGVPLIEGGYKTKTARDIIVVKTSPDILPMEPTVGQHWRIKGTRQSKSVIHGDFHLSEHHFIEPEKCEVTLPHDGENFIRFIASEKDFKGIGDVKARELWHKFKNNIFNILQQKDVDKLCEILTSQSAISLIEGFKKYANLKYSTWFADRKIPPRIQRTLFKYHKESSIQAITENPYRLVTFGMSFSSADKIAQNSFEISNEDPRRLVGAVEDILKKHSHSGGHTLASHQDIFIPVSQLLKSKQLASNALQVANASKSYFIDKETGSYHHTPQLVMEKVVAKRLIYLNQTYVDESHEMDVAFHQACADLPYQLTEKQADAVLVSLKNAVSCITGGAGTGKTTVLRTVLKAYHVLGYNISAMALSGRAAMRLHQSIGFRTSTIAAFLRDEPIEGERKNIVVIDEASMIDLPTMYKIVAHISHKVRLLFVGDYNQLPPIGAGLILADIVKSQVIPNTELDIVQRQDATTGIPEYSRMIKQGELPPHISIGNIHFHDVVLEQVASKCVELYSQSPTNSQIVAATKKLTNEINLQCQSSINPDGERLIFDEFGQFFQTNLLLNDPVLFTKNNYDAGIQNGSLGKLISVEQTEFNFGVVKMDDTNEEVVITKPLLDSLEAGYCITLHKAQGSQFKRVIVALSSTKMLDRAWLYTAITRSEDEIHIIGTRARFEQAVRSLSAHHIRKTHLSKLLMG
jgi:exodeoxyribonuclease V alpha subunit